MVFCQLIVNPTFGSIVNLACVIAVRAHRTLDVDAEAIIALSEAQMLERYGYAVVTVHSGQAAIEATDADAGISLVLMDIDLGRGMDGTEAAIGFARECLIPSRTAASSSCRSSQTAPMGTPAGRTAGARNALCGA